ncbi:helix-turn-helix transcriptional regulator [Arthrobacter sp. ok362]|uniref:ArsR/SmtB family transcription factor n=1 Tax=Arthrobacter sp. ok362 TaxID=1761745 RepID=UPI00087FAAC6|nr:metalloregulator ArsR/SmtB family transcription factor [Arthrobacter sp. ok362]SDL93189.1 DNA-binding transcriptional regulator, ArsR family [Arthrobacter sp. ok362]
MLNNSVDQPLSDRELDVVFHALADPTRRAILVRLCDGPAAVSELAAPFGMSLPAVVQHLQVLEASGLIRSEKIGRVRSCSIDHATVRRAEDWLGQRRTPGERRLDRLEDFLSRGQPASNEHPPSPRSTQ